MHQPGLKCRLGSARISGREPVCDEHRAVESKAVMGVDAHVPPFWGNCSSRARRSFIWLTSRKRAGSTPGDFIGPSVPKDVSLTTPIATSMSCNKLFCGTCFSGECCRPSYGCRRRPLIGCKALASNMIRFKLIISKVISDHGILGKSRRGHVVVSTKASGRRKSCRPARVVVVVKGIAVL